MTQPPGTQPPNEQGQTMAEYALVVGVISALILLTLTLLANTIGDKIMVFVGFFPD